MTKLLEQAFEAARALPPELQDDAARLLLQFVGDDTDVIPMTPEEEATFDLSHAQAAHGEFATDEQVRAIWAIYGL